MTKHTPGPWELEGNDSVVVMSGQAVIVGPAPDGEPFARQQANARLIAKAPELLAMLEQLANEYQDMRKAHGINLSADGLCASLSGARALIQQAKGE